MAGVSTGDIRSRIKSIESTTQVTKAMELVATSKLRRAKQRVEDSRPFSDVLRQTIAGICKRITDSSSVYTDKRTIKKTCYVVFGGDRGLAGGYNANVFKLFSSLAKDAGDDGCCILPIGKKAIEHFGKTGIEIVNTDFSIVSAVSVGDCYSIGKLLCEKYENGEFDRLVVVYTKFVSMLTQEPVYEEILPFGIALKNEAKESELLYEGDPETILSHIVPQYVGGVLYSALCESSASEYGARRTAMNSANKNAGEIIDELVLKYNRARQAVITQEITEIVSGAEAL